jgi:hypothetical protein
LKKGHKQQQSEILDMYEPHWSAANRYLEMASGGGAEAGSTSSVPSSPPQTAAVTASTSTITTPNMQHQQQQHVKDMSNLTLFRSNSALKSPLSPLSPLSPSSTLGRAHSVSGPGGTLAGSRNQMKSIARPGIDSVEWENNKEMLQDSEGQATSSGLITLVMEPVNTAPGIAPPTARIGSDLTATMKSTTNTIMALPQPEMELLPGEP